MEEGTTTPNPVDEFDLSALDCEGWPSASDAQRDSLDADFGRGEGFYLADGIVVAVDANRHVVLEISGQSPQSLAVWFDAVCEADPSATWRDVSGDLNQELSSIRNCLEFNALDSVTQEAVFGLQPETPEPVWSTIDDLYYVCSAEANRGTPLTSVLNSFDFYYGLAAEEERLVNFSGEFEFSDSGYFYGVEVLEAHITFLESDTLRARPGEIDLTFGFEVRARIDNLTSGRIAPVPDVYIAPIWTGESAIAAVKCFAAPATNDPALAGYCSLVGEKILRSAGQEGEIPLDGSLILERSFEIALSVPEEDEDLIVESVESPHTWLLGARQYELTNCLLRSGGFYTFASSVDIGCLKKK